MKKRQVIIVALAILILVVGKLTSDFLATPKEKKAQKPKAKVATVFTKVVKNDSVDIHINLTGVLQAVRRMELFSEVQGVMLDDQGRFKAGNAFSQGDLLLAIRSADQKAQLNAQRSNFESSLTSVMPDLKTDFPKEAEVWEQYLKNLISSTELEPLPEGNSTKLRSFLVARGVYNSYHALKNLSIINAKYQIRAPFSGELISAEVDPGTVIRPGQPLGVYIQTDVYEMETSIDAATADRLAIGQKVMLQREGKPEKKWEGSVSRIVKAIDQASRLNTFYVSVQAKDLKEGMFMNAQVAAKAIPKAIELSRSALVGKDEVYVVQADTLSLQKVKNEFYTKNTVVLTGLADGSRVLTKVPPSAFSGMKVSVYQAEQ